MIDLLPARSYETAFRCETVFGWVTGVHLPAEPAIAPEGVLARLHPDERAFAATCRFFRHPQFVGGRLAMADALGLAGWPGGPVLPDERGAPRLPAGVTGSIAHTRRIAVAIAASGTHGLGIDVESTARSSLDIAPRVLCPDELAQLGTVDQADRLAALLVRFSAKEAIYKALHPFVRETIGFHDVTVWPVDTGAVRVDLRAAHIGGFAIRAWHTRFDGQVLSIAEAHGIQSAADS